MEVPKLLHLVRYLYEQAPLQQPEVTDAERFDFAVKGMVGKRLTCAEVTGRWGPRNAENGRGAEREKRARLRYARACSSMLE